MTWADLPPPAHRDHAAEPVPLVRSPGAGRHTEADGGRGGAGQVGDGAWGGMAPADTRYFYGYADPLSSMNMDRVFEARAELLSPEVALAVRGDRVLTGWYGSIENLFQSIKAAVAAVGREEAFKSQLAEQMRNAKPTAAKALGRTVRGLRTPEWRGMRFEAMLGVRRMHAASHPDMRRLLSGLRGTLVAEAASRDREWGIGYTETAAKRTPMHMWGSNLAGKVVMRLSEEIFEQARAPSTGDEPREAEQYTPDWSAAAGRGVGGQVGRERSSLRGWEGALEEGAPGGRGEGDAAGTAIGNRGGDHRLKRAHVGPSTGCLANPHLRICVGNVGSPRGGPWLAVDARRDGPLGNPYALRVREGTPEFKGELALVLAACGALDAAMDAGAVDTYCPRGMCPDTRTTGPDFITRRCARKRDLAGRVARGQHVELLCVCFPRHACHCDFLRDQLATMAAAVGSTKPVPPDDRGAGGGMGGQSDEADEQGRPALSRKPGGRGGGATLKGMHGAGAGDRGHGEGGTHARRGAAGPSQISFNSGRTWRLGGVRDGSQG